MKFIIDRTIQQYNGDRVSILRRNEEHFKGGSKIFVDYLCNVVIAVTKGWDMCDKFPVVDDSCSIQYRPKGIYSNKKGFYYKNKKIIYLTNSEVEEMLQYISEASQYLKEKQWKLTSQPKN